MDPLDALYERVRRGIEWLAEHDPIGNFHIWFKSGILPGSPAIKLHHADEEEAYRVYYPQRQNFERLWRQMEALERQAGAEPAFVRNK